MSQNDISTNIDVLKNFAIITKKHQCWILFLRNMQVVLLKRDSNTNKAAAFSKKSLWHQCFTVNFVKFLGTPFFTEYLWWLLLLAQTVFSSSCFWTQYQCSLYKCLQKQLFHNIYKFFPYLLYNIKYLLEIFHSGSYPL